MSRNRLFFSALIVCVIAISEMLGGWYAHSLSLLSDGGHMLSDCISLCIAGVATWIAVGGPSKKHSYGLGRVEILAAGISSAILFAMSISIIVHAIHRIFDPATAIHSVIVMWVAGLSIVLNLWIIKILGHDTENLNVRAAWQHVMSDLLASGVAFVSGIVIYWKHWTLIDPILSIIISAIIMLSSIRLFQESASILMEAVPKHISFHVVEQAIQMTDGVLSVHDLHIWNLDSKTTALSAHVHVHDLQSWHDILPKIQKQLNDQFKINHITLQPEYGMIDCAPCHIQNASAQHG